MSLRQTCRTIFSLLFLASINPGIAQAQVVPDNTLRTFVEQLQNMRKITGGEKVGTNLFHSFEEFSIPEGIEVFFDNGLDIENIFTRITGNEASFIDGLLKTSGGANFFLINPNGIVFGENARLDVGGSFFATTADQVEFGDGIVFSARGSENDLLKWNAPRGLDLRPRSLILSGNNGDITVNGSGEQITRQGTFGANPYLRNRTSGLSVPSGETLALIGKGINFNGGVVVTDGGKIEVGSINTGIVRLEENGNSDGWTFGYEGIKSFENINFNQNSLIDPSGTNTSSIAVFGKDITLTDNSILLIQNNETKADGAIRIQASALLEISNESNIITETTGEGNTSPISIVTKNLLVQNSGAISSGTYSLGRGGDINIVVSEKLETINSATLTTPGSIFAFTADAGNSGDISISAQEVQASQGSSISSSTTRTGNGGDISISADLVELNGQIGENGRPTFIGSVTFGQKGADAGAVSLEVSNLKLINGAAISSDSSSDGSSGNVNVNATDLIEVIGIEPNQPFPSLITSSVTVEENEAIRSLLGLPLSPQGNAGDVTINTPTLNIAQGGVVRVRNQSIGNAGKLTINADNLNLDESASITAAAESGIGGNIELNTQSLNISNDSIITTTANGNENGGNITINTTNLNAKKNSNITASSFEGDGGNIRIDANDSISLKDQNNITARSEFGNGGNIDINSSSIQLDNSNISASAGGDGNGGNVTITADSSFLAVNSDVTANGFRGDGGNIFIDAEVVFGIEERPATPGNGTSDADASSEFGQDGTVNITNPQSDAQDPLIALQEPETTFTEVELKNDCLNKTGGNTTIVYTGRSSFDIPPEKVLDGEVYLPAPGFVPPPEEPTEEWVFPDWREGDPIIDSNAIRVDENGNIYAVAELTPQSARDLLCGATAEESNPESELAKPIYTKQSTTNRQSD